MTKYFIEPFAENGDKIVIPDDLQPSGSVSYNQGFGFDYQRNLATDPLAKPFPRQGFNGLIYDMTDALKQYQEHGFFDFITPAMNDGQPFNYSMGASVRYDMSDAQDGSDVRNFSSKINNNTTNPKESPENWTELGGSIGSSGYQFTNINVDTTLTIDQAGIILIDASAGNLAVTLPDTDLSISYILKRIDNSANIVRVQISGTNKIRYHLNVNANGYNFLYLMGAGDYWEIASDGAGNWWEIDRLDSTSLGSFKFLSSIIAPVGGYILANGAELTRADYPCLWDYAQQSGMIVAEADRTGFEGSFTTGNGTSTFRIPDLRGEFLRVLDNGRGADPSRTAGSWQKGSFSVGDHTRTSPLVTGLYNFRDDDAATFWERAGYDAYDPNVYDSQMVGSANNSIAQLTADSYAVSRPRNSAYPVYIKII